MRKAVGDQASKESLAKTATEAAGGTPDDLARSARGDSDKYARLVRELNIKLS
jgi:hypothetical protein